MAVLLSQHRSTDWYADKALSVPSRRQLKLLITSLSLITTKRIEVLVLAFTPFFSALHGQ